MPPTPSMRSETSRDVVRSRVPLKVMCSMKWASPARSRLSPRDPTSTYAATASARVPGMRAEMTRGPPASALRSNIGPPSYTGSAPSLPRRRSTVRPARPARPGGRLVVHAIAGLRKAHRPELHLHVVGVGESELLLDRSVAGSDVGRHEPQDDPLVALDEHVADELIGSRLELQVLPGRDREADRERREERGDIRAIGDDALDPAGAVGDDPVPTEVLVGDRLAVQRTQQVIDVGGIGDQAIVDEELGWSIARHAPSQGRPDGSRCRRPVVRWYATADAPVGPVRRPYHRAP